MSASNCGEPAVDDYSRYAKGAIDQPPNKYGWFSECRQYPGTSECPRGYARTGSCGNVSGVKWCTDISRNEQPDGCAAGYGRTICQRDWGPVYRDVDYVFNCCNASPSYHCSPDLCSANQSVTGSKCYNAFSQKCADPSHFFSDACKTWLKNLGKNALKDQLATKICPTIKSTGTESQKLFCSCYNVEMPEELKDDSALQGQVLCLSEKCQKDGLIPSQHYGNPCPLNYVVCKQSDILQKLYDGGSIGKSEIAQKCGITVSSSGKIPPAQPGKSDDPVDDPVDDPGTSGTSTEDEDEDGWDPVVVGIIVTISILVFIIIVFFVYKSRRTAYQIV